MIATLQKKTANLEYAPSRAYRLEYASNLDGLNDWAIICPGQSDTCIVCLHGHGSHGDQLFTRPDIRQAWLAKFLQLKASILCPNLRDNAWMSPAAVDDLSCLLQYLRNEHCSTRFLFFTGSMGGTGALIYAAIHPEDIDACIALGAAADLAGFYEWCMQQPSESTCRQLGSAIQDAYGCKPEDNKHLFDTHSVLQNCDKLTMPLFFAHGQKDQMIPVEQARTLAEKMAAKDSFAYHEIPDGAHDSPLFIPEAFDFLDQVIC